MYLCHPKKSDVIVTENKVKQVVRIPIKVCQDLLEKEIPEEINTVLLRIFPWCLGFALTMKANLDK